MFDLTAFNVCNAQDCSRRL